MCLKITSNKKIINDFLSKFKKYFYCDGAYTYCYKQVFSPIGSNKFYSPYLINDCNSSIIDSNRLSSELTNEELCTGIVKYGIHVYTNIDAAKAELLPNTNCRRYSILLVKCFLKDLVAIGNNNNAVFTKIYKLYDVQ